MCWGAWVVCWVLLGGPRYVLPVRIRIALLKWNLYLLDKYSY